MGTSSPIAVRFEASARPAGKTEICLVIVTDMPLYCEQLRSVLSEHEGFRVVATAANRTEALEAALKLRPTVVLVDTGMLESAEVVGDIRQADKDAKIIAISVQDTEDALISWAEAGVAGFVFRSGTTEDVLGAIGGALKGEVPLPPCRAAELVRYLAAAARGVSLPTLTNRQREVVRLIDQGLCNKEIAERLRVELSTVKNHVHNILEKLHVHRRIQVVALVRQRSPRGS